jgi:hypothetical protein
MAFNRLGVNAANGAATTRATETALFQKLYLTEVIAAFNARNIMSGIVQSRSITNGKSATFPAAWKTTAQYHILGTDLAGTNSVQATEITIPVDRVLESDILIGEIDELMSYYDVRGLYSMEQGNALAIAYDKHLLALGLKAARQTLDRFSGLGSPTVPWAGSARQSSVVSSDQGESLIMAIYDGLQTMITNDVPTDPQDVTAIFKPAQYFKLITDSDGTGTIAANSDYGGNGGIGSGRIQTVGGVPIVMTNHLPQVSTLHAATPVIANERPPAASGELVAGTPENNYQADFTATRGLILHRTCLATVKLMDLTLESEYLIQKQGTLMVSKMAVGHGIVREEAAHEIILDATSGTF